MVDIGSNSVRLVVYEGLTRSPAVSFNEKVLCGLGREVQSTGLLAADAVASALGALKRFRALGEVLEVGQTFIIATAACRDARNGPDFIAQAEAICGTKIDVLSGKREAQLSAMGIISGLDRADGIAGDLGGGSLELVDINGGTWKRGTTLPLGGLALQDVSAQSVKRAEHVVKAALKGVEALEAGAGRAFYAVGGTWRSLAKLHMWQVGYPLHITHGYRIPAREVFEFSRLVRRVDAEMLSRIDVVSHARRPLLAYGALVLENVMRAAKAREVVFSALGVREGLLYSLLDREEQKRDPLLAAARHFNLLRARAPEHADELIAWTDAFMASSKIEETREDKRLRHAACLLADIAWRAHPDYRGGQALDLIAEGAFVGVDHPGRTFLALAIFFRHVGLSVDDLSPRMRELASARMLDRARILGGAMRIAYLLSAAMPGVLPRAPLRVERGRLVLRLTAEHAALGSERVHNRLKQLARLIGREPALVAG